MMKHPSHGDLLLLAYGELTDTGAIEAHVVSCADCRTQLAELERGRAALDLATSRRPVLPWVGGGLALAAAALVAAVALNTSGGTAPAGRVWQPLSAWSADAGYVTGGREMREIDARLTRLEREGERYHGLPN
jgi:hypothetical protein